MGAAGGCVVVLLAALVASCGSSGAGTAGDAGGAPDEGAAETGLDAAPTDGAVESATESGPDAPGEVGADAGRVPWPPSLPAGAVDYYVSTTGDDANDGSAAHPWLTIAHAASTIAAGGKPITVHVLAGTYALTSATCITSSVDGTASAPITFVSDVRGAAKIDGKGACTTIWTQNGAYTRVWGFDFTGIQFAPSDCTGSGGSAVFYAGPPMGNVDFGYAVVHDLPWGFAAAVIMEPYAGNAYTGAPSSVHDSAFLNIGNTPADAGCGPPNNYGMYIASGPQTYVFDNLLVNVPTIAIHCWHAASGVHIFDNTIVNAGTAMLVGTGDGGATVGAYYEVANNIVVSSQSGIYAEANAPGTLSTSSVFENNLVYGNQQDWGYNDNGNSTTLQAAGLAVTGTITADPEFVNAAAGDYRLSAGSPAIDRGIGNGAPDHDLDGYVRPYGAGYDIGAYEWHGL
jgi:hypothetical protein